MGYKKLSMTDVSAAEDTNAQPYSVSELAFALKRTIEDAYGFVRLRGELSKVTFHGNGHVYLDLKDERASISGVIWKGQVRGLAIRPETGLEVDRHRPGHHLSRPLEIPDRHRQHGSGGVGALLAQFERLKARLADEDACSTPPARFRCRPCRA